MAKSATLIIDNKSYDLQMIAGTDGPDVVDVHVHLWEADALPPGVGYSERALTSTGDIAPTPAMGQGFGLGFAVRTAAGHNPLPGSIGNYYWTGAWGTTFWVDPAEKLIAIQMIQTPSEAGGPYRRAFRNLVYQALTNQE